MSQSVLPMFSFQSSIVFGLTFRSLIHFKFIFVYGVRKCSNVTLLHIAFQSSQLHLLNKLSLLHRIFLPPLSKLSCPQVHGFIFGLPILCHWSVFVFVPVRYCLDEYSFVVQSEVRKVDASSSIFFLKIALAIQGLLCLHMNCETFCSTSMKNAIGSLIRIALNLQIALGSIVIITILILPIQEQGISLQLFRSSFFHQCPTVFCIQLFCLPRQVYSQVFCYFCCNDKWD